MSTPHINALREHLMDTLSSLRDKKNPMEPDRARAVAQVASVLVDTARVRWTSSKRQARTEAGFLRQKKCAQHCPTMASHARCGKRWRSHDAAK